MSAVEQETSGTAPAARPPAKTYKFNLDPFQKAAVGHIENNESVLVAAHTSAGKTAIAEYAIATSLRDKQRVIYTSPIKALSNQKFRDLQGEFSDVGLMTGDVTIDPNASCLVMTTEILRSMLYRGSEVMREVAWVIFDEVHYLRDSERGVVWEESIILVPHKVRFVFLSATIPNAAEFAKWVESVHQQPCHVVYTDYRPTPLQHYMYASGSDGLFLVVDEKGKFNDKNFQAAMAVLGPEDGTGVATGQGDDGTGGAEKAKKKMRRGGKSADLERIMRMIIDKKYNPVIVFSFSKKECETYASQMFRAELALTNEDDKGLINKIFDNAMDSLSEDDRKLPQVQSLLPLLRRGIGIHHGGLLPILKEIVEILFGEGLLKCLFATETFAMGINMPAKTVVFTAHRKFDGSTTRIVRSGEYIQMSGRAGRRGLDDRGIVILMVDERMDMEQAKAMMSGKADPLTSSFYLGYNMVLNLMRVEDADPEYIVKNSFFAFQREQAIPDMIAKQQDLLVKAEAIKIDQKDLVVAYHRLASQFASTEKEIRRISRSAKVLKRFVSGPGRLVKVDNGWSWGIVVGGLRIPAEEEDEKAGSEGLPSVGATVDCLVCCDPVMTDKDVPSASADAEFRVVCVPLVAIAQLSMIVLNLPKDLKPLAQRKKALGMMKEVFTRFDRSDKKGIPLLDDKQDLQLASNERFVALEEKCRELGEMLEAHPLHLDVRKDALLKKRSEQLKLEMEAAKLEKEVKAIKTLPLKDELKRMKAVLRRLGHVDKDDVVQLKGRVACEISTSNELLACELLMSGAFNNLDPSVCAAVCSCLVFEREGGSDDIDLGAVKPELSEPFKTVQQCARRVAEVMADCDCPVDVQEFVDDFRPDLMEVVLMWCRGSKFRDICELTSVFEGSIVRTVRREAELLRQLCAACKVIGDEALEAKFARAVELMQKDIMFAASLYL